MVVFQGNSVVSSADFEQKFNQIVAGIESGTRLNASIAKNILFGMIIGLVANRGREIPVLDSFFALPDENFGLFVVDSQQFGSNVVNFCDVISICKVGDCKLVDVQPNDLAEVCGKKGKTTFVTQVTRICNNRSNGVSITQSEVYTLKPGLNGTNSESQLAKKFDFIKIQPYIPDFRNMIGLLAKSHDETDDAIFEMVVATIRIFNYMNSWLSLQRHSETILKFFLAMFDAIVFTTGHLHVKINENASALSKNQLSFLATNQFLRWINEPSGKLVISDHDVETNTCFHSSDKRYFISINKYLTSVNLNSGKRCPATDNGETISDFSPVSHQLRNNNSIHSWDVYLSDLLTHVPNVKSTLLSVQQYFLWFFRGLVIGQAMETHAIEFKLSTVAESLSKGYRIDVVKLTYPTRAFKAVVRIPLNSSHIDLVSDNANGGILTYNASMYQDINLNVPKKLITAINATRPFKKYVKRLFEDEYVVETLYELVHMMERSGEMIVRSQYLVAFINGLIVDECSLLSPDLKTSNVMVTVCPNRPKNLVLVLENETHLATDEIIELYKNDLTVREYLTRKPSLIVGLKDTNVNMGTININLVHELEPKSVCFLKQHSEIKQRFPHNQLSFTNYINQTRYRQPVMVSLKTQNADRCDFVAVGNISENLDEIEEALTNLNSNDYTHLVVDDKFMLKHVLNIQYVDKPDRLQVSINISEHLLFYNMYRFPEVRFEVLMSLTFESIEEMTKHPVSSLHSELSNDTRNLYLLTPDAIHTGTLALSDTNIWLELDEVSFKNTSTYDELVEDSFMEEITSINDIVFCGRERFKKINQYSTCLGSSSNDYIILVNTSVTQLEMIAGLEGQNTLDLTGFMFHDDSTEVSLNRTGFHSQKLLTYGGENPIVVEHVQRFIGRPGMQDNVHSDCFMTDIDTRGGKNETQLDEVILDDEYCGENYPDRIHVHVEPFTRVNNTRSSGHFVYLIKTSAMEKENTSVIVEILPNIPGNSKHFLALDCQSTRVSLDNKITSNDASTIYWFEVSGQLVQKTTRIKLAISNRILNRVELHFVDFTVAVFDPNSGKMILHYFDAVSKNPIMDFVQTNLNFKSIGLKQNFVAFEQDPYENVKTVVVFENNPEKKSAACIRAPSFILNIRADPEKIETEFSDNVFQDILLYDSNLTSMIFINARNLWTENFSQTTPTGNIVLSAVQNVSSGHLIISFNKYNNQELIGEVKIANMMSDISDHESYKKVFIYTRHNVFVLEKADGKFDKIHIRPLLIKLGFSPNKDLPPLQGAVLGPNSSDWMAFKMPKLPELDFYVWLITEDNYGTTMIRMIDRAKIGTSSDMFQVIAKNWALSSKADRQPIKIFIDMDENDVVVLILKR